jgi:hypothetical protein
MNAEEKLCIASESGNIVLTGISDGKFETSRKELLKHDWSTKLYVFTNRREAESVLSSLNHISYAIKFRIEYAKKFTQR